MRIEGLPRATLNLKTRTTLMSEKPISPLRRRMIEDMTVLGFVESKHPAKAALCQ